MAVTEISTAAQNAHANGVVDLLDAGSGPGELEIYDGTIPGPNAGPAGTLLVTITLDDPAFGNASSGVATAADLDPTNWIADGTADYWRAVDSDGNVVMQGDCSVTAGSGSLKLSSITAVTGSPVDVTAFTYTAPSGE
jgi:hypothetical protein